MAIPQVDARAYHSQAQMEHGGPKARPEGSLSMVAEHLLEHVTQYHAKIGTNVGRTTLQALESGMLTEGRKLTRVRNWEEALNVYTHALAVSEKLNSYATVLVPADPSAQGAIVLEIASCLHNLGELEAAKAYYEQACMHAHAQHAYAQHAHAPHACACTA